MARTKDERDALPGKGGVVPSLPRLEDLDAEPLARQIQALLLTKHRELSALLQQPIAEPEDPSPPLLTRVQQLIKFARLGEGRAKAEKALELLEVAIYGRPADKMLDTKPTEGAFASVLIDIETPVGTVLAAARARLDLQDGRPTNSRELAALAGVSRSRVPQLLRSGELQYTERGSGRANTTITPESARAWLQSRRVPGF